MKNFVEHPTPPPSPGERSMSTNLRENSVDFFKDVTFRNVVFESVQLLSFVRFGEFPSPSLSANPGWVKAEDQTAKVLILSGFIRHVVK